MLAARRVGDHGRVIGIDINADMLALARKRTADLGNVEIIRGEIESLPLESASVDWVISNCVINLAQDKHSVFQEIARVLRPGGRMLISDIVADRLPGWVRHSGLLHAACGGGVISEKRYLAELHSAGLKECGIIARQHYTPEQLAAIVSDAAPAFARNIRCCGRPILHSTLTRLARPIADNLWSARISARR